MNSYSRNITTILQSNLRPMVYSLNRPTHMTYIEINLLPNRQCLNCAMEKPQLVSHIFQYYSQYYSYTIQQYRCIHYKLVSLSHSKLTQPIMKHLCETYYYNFTNNNTFIQKNPLIIILIIVVNPSHHMTFQWLLQVHNDCYD